MSVGDRATESSELVDELAGSQELADLPEPRMRLLVGGWLAGFRSGRTRRAYAGDLVAWRGWCETRGLDPLGARRVQVDLWMGDMLSAGMAASTASRRLSALSSFYGFLAEHDDLEIAGPNPTQRVRRPAVDSHHSPTLGLTREEAQALLGAADRATGPQRLRNGALLRLLLHNALRVDELLSADLADLARFPGQTAVHDTLEVSRKGGRRTRVAFAPATMASLEHYLVARAVCLGVDRRELHGPVIATSRGRRLAAKTVWELVQRTARHAGIEQWQRLSPHSLRHTAITLALDAGAPLRDVQDFAGHRDARTTRRYDRSRESLDRSPTFALTDWLRDRP